MKTSTKAAKTSNGLTAEAAATFERLAAEFGIEDSAGRVLLRSACECLDRIGEARAILKRDGLTITVGDSIRPHPCHAIERDARAAMHSAMRLLRLDASEVE